MTFDDIKALRTILPPKTGELLRAWMLRCVSTGLISRTEALEVKNDNPKAWDSIYKISK